MIYAEAHTHTAGFDSQTQAALNELRDRCGMPDVPTSLSKEEGLELIANERRIELAAEGFRSDDMYRYSDEYWNKHINNVEIAAPDGDNIITMSWNPRMRFGIYQQYFPYALETYSSNCNRLESAFG